MAKKSTKIELNIVFDTNALHTVASHDLLNAKTKKLIETHTNYTDITINWYLPDVVVLERQFQMYEAGRKLLPNIEKMELLLGHKLNINDDILKSRVELSIKSQIENYKINRMLLNTEKIDWQKIIQSSTSRMPPFENNDKEKGFRDAIILETFAQIVEISLQNSKKCKNILITGDRMLTVATNDRFKKPNNIKICESIEKCEEFINLLKNEVTEEYIKLIEDKISSYFYNNQSNSGFFIENEIRKQIESKFQKELKQLYPTSTIREAGDLYISEPTFNHKEGQKYYWTTEITIEGYCYKKVEVNKQDDDNFITILNSLNSRAIDDTSRSIDHSGSILRDYQNTFLASHSLLNENFSENINRRLIPIPKKYIEQKVKVAKCNSYFEIDWSIVIKTNHVFGMSQLEQIRFVEHQWTEV